MNCQNKQFKLKSYIVIIVGIILGFSLGIYIARPSLEKPTQLQVDDVRNTEAPQKEQSKPPAKESSVLNESRTNEVIEEISFTVRWISVENYLKIYQNNDILSLDIRSPAEYKVGHIRTSKLFPFDEIDNYSATLPDDKKVILYANDLAFKNVKSAYKKLLDSGLKEVILLEVTYDQWQNAGNPIETGNPFEE